MDKLANLEARFQKVKEEETKKNAQSGPGLLSSLRFRRTVQASAEPLKKAMETTESDGIRAPLLTPVEDDWNEGSLPSTPPSSVPSPEPKDLSDGVIQRYVRSTGNSFIDRHYRVISLGVEVLLWATLFYIFILLEFGFVYFGFSILYFMWRNTRTRSKKKEGELSAYSVFNPNCEPIHGTVSPTQLTRELGLAIPLYQ